MNKIGNGIKYRSKANDKIYTPLKVAKLMIDLCDIKDNDMVLDCSKGGGVFYDNYPDNCRKDYCEIEENKDFLKYKDKVDWIIGNPPYSLWKDWLNHTITITDKFCYIFGVMNLVPSRFKNIYDNGFIVSKIHLLEVDWWFGRSVIVVFEKGDQDNNILPITSKPVLCDICGVKCMRGRTQSIKGVKKKWGMNECSKINK